MKFDPTKYERSYRPNFELTQAFWWQQGVFASGIGSLVYLATHGFAVWPVYPAPASPVLLKNSPFPVNPHVVK